MIYEEFAHNQRASISEDDAALLKLWAHVFALGLKDYAEDCQRVEQGAFPREPSYWFWAHANTTGSFVWLCDLFKIDPQRARLQALANLEDLLPKSYVLAAQYKQT